MDDSIAALKSRSPRYFLSRLSMRDYPRVVYSFPDKTLFLDIETTGLSPRYHYVTMVGWLSRGKYGYWVRGTSPRALLEEVSRAEVLVTFNGISFDCKFLDREFGTDLFSLKPNLDLMHLCRRHGLTGGQKAIEKKLGFSRPHDFEGADGREAVALWYRFLFGEEEGLSRLTEYNRLDVLGMAFILDRMFLDVERGTSFPQGFDAELPLFFPGHNLSELDVPYGRAAARIRGKVLREKGGFEISRLARAGRYRIVGIDLAGVSGSHTGICTLIGRRASTKALSTDDEILGYVHEARPDLVCVDAPLSLPKGRTSVYDDDPAREECGITRYSERVLRSRGVNVYPALIRSMQELTRRGMALASRLRREGYPVIECFPGAAQDVIQLPRKKTDVSLLKGGLVRFGVRGRFERDSVVHDELDAITAALVGQFYISGYYEALGIPEENDLVLPSSNHAATDSRIVVAACGPSSKKGLEVLLDVLSSMPVSSERKGDSNAEWPEGLRVSIWEVGEAHKRTVALCEIDSAELYARLKERHFEPLLLVYFCQGESVVVQDSLDLSKVSKGSDTSDDAVLRNRSDAIFDADSCDRELRERLGDFVGLALRGR